MPRPQRLDHVSLNVRDREASIEWYREMLGLAQQNEPSADEEPVFLGPFGACIALFQARTESASREQESTGLRHVAFALSGDELEAARSHLASRGVVFRPEDHGNALSLSVPDLDGHLIELTTYDR